MTNEIRVLCVDDDPESARTTATMLEAEAEELTVRTETDVGAALDRFESEPFDCVVSDYEMPGTDGLEFLAGVRDVDDEFPFVLYTARGSEEIAAEAISRGVTDYIQKQRDVDHYALLARRVRNGVEKYRAAERAARTRRFLEKLVERASDVIAVVDDEMNVEYVSGSVEHVLGYTPGEIVEMGPFGAIVAGDRDRVRQRMVERMGETDVPRRIHFDVETPGGETVSVSARAYDMRDDPDVGGVVIYLDREERLPPPE